MHVGQRIRELRLNLQLTQEELSKMLGYTSKTTINKIELGKNDVSATKLKEFAKALQTSPLYLIGLTDDPQPLKKLPNNQPQLSEHEQEIILKYRCLDARGKYAIDTTLQREYEFYLSEQRNSIPGA